MSENPQNLMPMAIENPLPVAPTLSAQEQSVLNGSVREQLTNAATQAGGIGGAVTGAIIGGIWSAASHGTNWFYKIAGVAGALGIAGALLGRASMEKQEGPVAPQIPVTPPAPVVPQAPAPTHHNGPLPFIDAATAEIDNVLSHTHGRFHNALGETYTEKLDREKAFEDRIRSV